MPSLFTTTTGFDGAQNVRLRDAGGNLIAGGDVDRFDANNGTWPAAGSAFSSTALARCRTSCGGNAAYAAFSDAQDTAGTASWSPGRAIRCNSTCRGNSHKHWPDQPSVYQSDNVDVVTVGDRGYFRSPAEVTKIEVAGKWATTLSLSSMDDPSQPDVRQLPGWVVAARAPARININTASTALMAAAFAMPRAACRRPSRSAPPVPTRLGHGSTQPAHGGPSPTR